MLTLKSGSVLAAPITNPGSNFLPISIVWFWFMCKETLSINLT